MVLFSFWIFFLLFLSLEGSLPSPIFLFFPLNINTPLATPNKNSHTPLTRFSAFRA